MRFLCDLDEVPLRSAQVEAIKSTEPSLAQQRFDRSLIRVATGAVKTYTAVTLLYRLLQHGGFAKNPVPGRVTPLAVARLRP